MIPSPTSPVPAESARPSTLAKRRGRKAISVGYSPVYTPAPHPHYINENDPFAVKWLRELMADGLIPTASIDPRSICDVQPDDVRHYTQCHWFGGIAGWPEALRIAGWPSTRSVWTGSCPCQPYSVAGKGKGDADPRNLWPQMFRLIRECRPEYVFGEQVESAILHGWLDGISSDLEREGYAVGSIVLGAHSAGAPHIRQRLYWGACRLSDARRAHESRSGYGQGVETAKRGQSIIDPESNRRIGRVSDAAHHGRTRLESAAESTGGNGAAFDGGTGRLSHADEPELRGLPPAGQQPIHECDHWNDSYPILCLDGKTRRIPTQPEFQFVADGIFAGLGDEWDQSLYPLSRGKTARTQILKGAGNAIVPQVAAQFIATFMECLP